MVKPSFRAFRFAIVVCIVLYGSLRAYAVEPPRKANSAFVTAAMKDDTVAMQRLLDHGANVNAPAEAGRPLLFQAILSQRSKAVAFLLAHGANINFKDREGKTPLHYAVGVSSAFMELLIARGADVNAVDRSGETPLFQAILHSPARALSLIAHGAGVTVQNNKCETPLHLAIFGVGEAELVKTLLAKGADVNAVDQDGQTPLDQTFDADITALLKAHGAVHGKQSPATATFSPLIATLPVSPTPLLLTTRLRRAVESDDIYAVQMLLANGADAKARDVDDSSPLAVALRINRGSIAPTPPNPNVLHALAAQGVDVNEKDTEAGQTLLMRAVIDNQTAAVDWLLTQGADVSQRDRKRGATALHYAQDPRTIRALLGKGAKIDSQDAGGDTALMSAVKNGRTEAVGALLSAHAHINIENKRGQTALTLARIGKKSSSLLSLLKQASAK